MNYAIYRESKKKSKNLVMGNIMVYWNLIVYLVVYWKLIFWIFVFVLRSLLADFCIIHLQRCDLRTECWFQNQILWQLWTLLLFNWIPFESWNSITFISRKSWNTASNVLIILLFCSDNFCLVLRLITCSSRFIILFCRDFDNYIFQVYCFVLKVSKTLRKILFKFGYVVNKNLCFSVVFFVNNLICKKELSKKV